MSRNQVTATKRKLTGTRTLIDDDPYLSQKKITPALALHHDIVKKLIIKELNFRRINFRWVPHTLTTSQNFNETLQAAEQKLSHRSRSLHHGNETWVSFENQRSAIWVTAEVRRPTRPK
jgi:hypothetical protein